MKNECLGIVEVNCDRLVRLKTNLDNKSKEEIKNEISNIVKNLDYALESEGVLR